MRRVGRDAATDCERRIERRLRYADLRRRRGKRALRGADIGALAQRVDRDADRDRCRPRRDRPRRRQLGLERAGRLPGQHAQSRHRSVVILLDRRDRRRGRGALRTRLLGIERRDEPSLDAEARDLEVVVLQPQRIARIGELRLIQPREHVVARGLGLRRQHDAGVIIARRLILRAARLDRAAHFAEQPDLILHVEPKRQGVARSASGDDRRAAGQGRRAAADTLRARIAARSAQRRQQLRARLDQRFARLAQPRDGLRDVEIVGPGTLDDAREQRIVELRPPGGEIGGGAAVARHRIQIGHAERRGRGGVVIGANRTRRQRYGDGEQQGKAVTHGVRVD